MSDKNVSADLIRAVEETYRRAWYTASAVDVFATRLLVHLEQINNPGGSEKDAESIVNLALLLRTAGAEADEAAEAFLAARQRLEKARSAE